MFHAAQYFQIKCKHDEHHHRMRLQLQHLRVLVLAAVELGQLAAPAGKGKLALAACYDQVVFVDQTTALALPRADGLSSEELGIQQQFARRVITEEVGAIWQAIQRKGKQYLPPGSDRAVALHSFWEQDVPTTYRDAFAFRGLGGAGASARVREGGLTSVNWRFAPFFYEKGRRSTAHPDFSRFQLQFCQGSFVVEKAPFPDLFPSKIANRKIKNYKHPELN